MRGFVGRVAVASLSNCRKLRAEGESTRSLLASSQKKHRFLSKELSRREPMRTKRCGQCP